MDEPIDHPLRTAVMEAIGAGSLAWEEDDGPWHGVFDTKAAVDIGNGLLAAIMERETEIITAAAQAVARCNAYLDLLQRADLIFHDVERDVRSRSVAFGTEIDMWRSGYRATLEYPPLANIGQLATEVEAGS